MWIAIEIVNFMKYNLLNALSQLNVTIDERIYRQQSG